MNMANATDDFRRNIIVFFVLLLVLVLLFFVLVLTLEESRMNFCCLLIVVALPFIIVPFIFWVVQNFFSVAGLLIVGFFFYLIFGFWVFATDESPADAAWVKADIEKTKVDIDKAYKKGDYKRAKELTEYKAHLYAKDARIQDMIRKEEKQREKNNKWN